MGVRWGKSCVCFEGIGLLAMRRVLFGGVGFGFGGGRRCCRNLFPGLGLGSSCGWGHRGGSYGEVCCVSVTRFKFGGKKTRGKMWEKVNWKKLKSKPMATRLVISSLTNLLKVKKKKSIIIGV